MRNPLTVDHEMVNRIRKRIEAKNKKLLKLKRRRAKLKKAFNVNSTCIPRFNRTRWTARHKALKAVYTKQAALRIAYNQAATEAMKLGVNRSDEKNPLLSEDHFKRVHSRYIKTNDNLHNAALCGGVAMILDCLNETTGVQETLEQQHSDDPNMFSVFDHRKKLESLANTWEGLRTNAGVIETAFFNDLVGKDNESVSYGSHDLTWHPKANKKSSLGIVSDIRDFVATERYLFGSTAHEYLVNQLKETFEVLDTFKIFDLKSIPLMNSVYLYQSYECLQKICALLGEEKTVILQRRPLITKRFPPWLDTKILKRNWKQALTILHTHHRKDCLPVVAVDFWMKYNKSLPEFSRLLLLSVMMRISAAANETCNHTQTWLQKAQRSRLLCKNVHNQCMITLRGCNVEDLSEDYLLRVMEVYNHPKTGRGSVRGRYTKD